jgi:threonyl-tRNA synthetase
MPAARELFDQIRAAGFRAVLKSDGPLRKRVRESELDKIPYMAVIGGREAENGEVNVRVHGEKKQSTMKIEDFISALNLKRSSKALDYALED